MEGYGKLEKVGEGTYGKVYRAREKANGKIVALKKTRLHEDDEAELVTTQALFPGDSELQQLLHIFRLLGTPNEEVWSGVSKLPNWHEFPQWSPQSLSKAVPSLDAVGLDLLSMLIYEPSKRISAKRAMEHPYFDGLKKDGL